MGRHIYCSKKIQIPIYRYCITKTPTLPNILSYKPETLQFKAEHGDTQTMQHQRTIPTQKPQYELNPSRQINCSIKPSYCSTTTTTTLRLFNPRLCIPQLSATSSQEQIPGRRRHHNAIADINKGN